MKRLLTPFKKYIRNDVSVTEDSFKPGDFVKAHIPITEGTRSFIKVVDGVCIRKNSETILIRHTSHSSSVELYISRALPIKIEKIRSGVVRRARLYYLRNLQGKSARIKESRRV